MSSDRADDDEAQHGHAPARGSGPLDQPTLVDPVVRASVDTPLRSLVELVPERQVAAAALNRARRNALDRGLRPGDAPRRRPLEVQLGGARAGGRDPQTIAATLGDLVGQPGWEPGMVKGAIKGRYPQIVGEEISRHSTFESFEGGVLTIRADSTSWAQGIQVNLPSLLRRLADELGEGVVVGVEVLGPGGPGFGRGPRSVKGRGVRDTYG